MLKNIKGFTMLETVIATAIVMIGIMGLLIASQSSVLVVYLARDRFTAAYLAKEGAEIVRNIRDQNSLRAITWNSGLALGNYIADFNDSALSAYTPNTFLRINPTGFYHYTDGTITKFTRRITITNIDVDSIRVEVRVNWDTHTFLLEEILYNWR
jgi:Tfp pilus assembly protein PilV